MSESPYVFISYAHRDIEVVLPCIQAMKANGINVWFDEGIEAGSEWPEYIANKVLNCTKFVLFISNAYLDSQNCKRELNFAISRKKDILSIFVEDVMLSPGMEMQLGTYQALYTNRFENQAQFYGSICREAFFNPCRLTDTPQSAYTQTQNPNYVPPTYTGASYNQSTFKQSSAPDKRLPRRNRIVAAILALTLGFFGVHKFYLKKYVWGIIYFIFCWTYIPWIVAMIEGIVLLCTSNEKFCQKYKCRIR